MRAVALGVLAVTVPVAVAAPAPSAPRGVDIGDSAVSPATVVVAPGTTIVWTDVGRNRHTVTADDGSFDSGTLSPGDTFTLTAPSAPGTIAYHCRFHEFIRGQVVVSVLALAPAGDVAFGARARFTGAAPGAPAGSVVSVERRVPGAWVPAGSGTVGPDGTFAVAGPLLRATAAFRAVLGQDLSPSARVVVRPRVDVARRGRVLVVRARPARSGTAVLLQRLDIDRYVWRTAGRGSLGPGGVARLALPPGGGVVRARVAAPGRGVASGVSRAVPVRPAPTSR